MCGTADQTEQPVELEVSVDRLKQRAWLLFEGEPEMRKKIMRFKWSQQELKQIIEMKLKMDVIAARRSHTAKEESSAAKKETNKQ